MNKSPAFQMYPGDWLASQRVQLMSLEEEGAYIRLLCYCWLHGSIPADPKRIALLIGKGGSTTLAETVSKMFQPHSENAALLVHERLETERQKQETWHEKSSEGGKKSAQIRAKKKAKNQSKSTVVQPPLEGCLPNGVNQNPTLQSSVFSLQSSSSSSEEEGKQTPPPPPPDLAFNAGEIPSVAEVVAHGATAGIPPEYCREFHERTTDNRMWLNSRNILRIWTKQIVVFWVQDREKWMAKRNGNGTRKTVAEQQADADRERTFHLRPDQRPPSYTADNLPED